MSLPTARGQLKAALSELMIRWDHVRQQWDDPVAQAFEKEFLLHLEPSIKKAVTAMGEMGELLAKARRDCGSD